MFSVLFVLLSFFCLHFSRQLTGTLCFIVLTVFITRSFGVCQTLCGLAAHLMWLASVLLEWAGWQSRRGSMGFDTGIPSVSSSPFWGELVPFHFQAVGWLVVPSQKAWINGEVAGKRRWLYVVIAFLGSQGTGSARSCYRTARQKGLAAEMAEQLRMGIGTMAWSWGPELASLAACRGFIGIPNKRFVNCRWETILEMLSSKRPASTPVITAVSKGRKASDKILQHLM